MAYRRLTADQWLVGTVERPDLQPNGGPVNLDINSLDFTATYGVTDRLNLSLTLPFSYGTQARDYTDSLPHKVSSLGLGDVNLTANAWVLHPAAHANGNFAFGLGVKTPSGSNHAQDRWYNTVGPSRYFVDQSVQRGDGGWGIILQTQAFQKLFPNGYGYLSGFYLVSPRAESDVFFSPSRTPGPGNPYAGVRLAVPDVYNARLGLVYALPDQGLSLSLGGRLDGIPVRDLVGGGENAFRRPAVVAYVEPGVAWARGNSTFTLSLPVRVFYDFRASLIDQQRIGRPGGGDLAKYLLFASYTIRP